MGQEVVDEAKLSITDFLNWTSWKDCGKCAYDEAYFVAIWPWGAVEDHETPGCIKNEMLSNRKGYWVNFWIENIPTLPVRQNLTLFLASVNAEDNFKNSMWFGYIRTGSHTMKGVISDQHGYRRRL